MIKNLQIDINYIVSKEATHLERVQLLKQILFEDMTDNEAVKVLKEILEYYRQTEKEFDQRPFIIKPKGNCKHENYTPCYGREGELMFKQCDTCGEEFD